jgi:hypothetical protein
LGNGATPGPAPGDPDDPIPVKPSTRGGGGGEMIGMITLGEVSQTITTTIKQIVLTIFDVLTPIINVVAIAQILLGLLLAIGLRQEYLGWRLCISGLLMLVFMNVVAPLLLSFI